jgi:hypothetical protein
VVSRPYHINIADLVVVRYCTGFFWL